MQKSVLLWLALTALTCSFSPKAVADAVLDWNAIALEAHATAIGAGRPGPIGALDMAMVHAAVYDAVQAIARRFEPYHVDIPDASGSPAAATAKAAHDVLVGLLPAQTAALDTTYHTYLLTQGLAEDDPGIAVGQEAAAGILALRAKDGRFPPNPPPFNGGTDPGEWRPTPPGFASMALPWLGAVTGFTLRSGEQFRATPPPSLSSRRYAKDYNEVKVLGAREDSARTPAQTELAYFWNDSFIALWNRTYRAIAEEHIHDIAESARLFALAGLATADALITAWDSKLYYNFWRPITAIHEGDADGNPRTMGDPEWQPFLPTPNYPDYTSGANNLTSAFTHTLALYFGTDNMTFSITSNNANLPLDKRTRTYERFSDAAQEVVDVRVYQGIHFRFADTAAHRQGRRVAQWVFEHFLHPIH